MSHIKEAYPHINKVHYFSDGCAGQYKNKFKFAKIYNHERDFGIKCVGHFLLPHMEKVHVMELVG